MNFYQHHIGDYAKDTGHLSMLEDAAYRRMLDVAYATEKPLPKDQQAVYRLVRARSHAEKLAVDVILGEFWTEGQDGWHNKRVDEEISKAHEKSAKARGSAAQRWQSERIANALRTHCEGNAPNNQEPETNKQQVQKLSAAPAAEVPDGTPDCPHEQLIALYHELLPNCPSVEEWNDTRRGLMRARWREKAKPNGKTQGYTTVEAGLAYWRVYFSYAAESRFLTGRSDGQQGRPPFVANLEWLIRPTNFAKVVEGNYHR